MSPEEQGREIRVNALKKSPAYRLAHADQDFISLPELRGIRLQLELKKAEMLQQAYGVNSTIVVFGGTRILERHDPEERLRKAENILARNPDKPDLERDVRIARNILKKSHYYDEARELGRIVSSTCQIDENCDYVIVTGGGPGIMEAANRGAYDVGAKSIGLNITIKTEQEPNSYISPELCFEFKYFAIRKMHFLMRAKALVALPGGFGTFDELFETLTLIQTGKSRRRPVLLFGREFWSRLINFDLLLDTGMISPGDEQLFHYVETAEEAWAVLETEYELATTPTL